MSFEPTIEDCTNKTTGSICIFHIRGNGKRMVGGCRLEQAQEKVVIPPAYCPLNEEKNEIYQNTSDEAFLP